MIHHVGIGGIGVSSRVGDVIATHALGSCVALTAFDPASHVWALAHVALPKSGPRPARAEPGYYGNLAVDEVIAQMARLGSAADGRSLRVALIGGASVISDLDSFDIGRRNALALKKALWRRGLVPVAEDLGGEISRTVKITVTQQAGVIEVSNPKLGVWHVREAVR